MAEVRALSSEKETRILDAAQKRFAVFGLSKVTMDEIAADVGMGKASLYYYFPTKEDLFRGVIQREQAELLRRLQEILAREITADEKLRHYVDQRLHYSAELVNLQVLSIYSWISGRPVFREQFESFAAQELKIVTDIVRAGKKAGTFEVRSPEATAELILHILQGLRLRSARDAHAHMQPMTISQELERESHQAIELIVRGLSKTTSHRE